MNTPQQRLHQIPRLWNQFLAYPFGKSIYSTVIGFMVPYSGSIPFSIDTIESGYAKVYMKDRRKVRNHLSSIHAMALMNLAELTGGLAAHSKLTDQSRGILKSLSIEFKKKARGKIYADCKTDFVETFDKQDVVLDIYVKNVSDDLVLAQAKAVWQIGPVKRG